jgi:hypothetical protein
MATSKTRLVLPVVFHDGWMIKQARQEIHRGPFETLGANEREIPTPFHLL